MASKNNRRKQIIEIIELEGVTLLSPVETGGRSSSHIKLQCEYKGERFFVVTSLAERGRLETWYEKFRGDVRRAKRAIDENEPTLLKKLGRREKTFT